MNKKKDKKRNAFLDGLTKKLNGEENEESIEFINRIQDVTKQASKLDDKSNEEIQEKYNKRLKKDNIGEMSEMSDDEISLFNEQFEESIIDIREEEDMFKEIAALQNVETEYAKMKIALNRKKEELIKLRNEYNKKYGIDS